MQGQMKIFRVGSRQFRESLRELLRELWVSYWSSRGRPFREWNFVFREWNFQFRDPRAAPRIPRNSPRAPRMALSLRERFFPEIGVVPRLLIGFRGRKKPININNFAGLSRKWVGVKLFMCFPFSWGKRETHKQNSQEISGKGQESPGTVPG